MMGFSLSATAKFKSQYGPWALIAGASEGLGEAFAEQLAQHGLNVALVARREALLNSLRDKLTAWHRRARDST